MTSDLCGLQKKSFNITELEKLLKMYGEECIISKGSKH